MLCKTFVNKAVIKTSHAFCEQKLLLGYVSEPKKFAGHTSNIKASLFSADGKRIFSASDDKTVRSVCVHSGVANVRHCSERCYGPARGLFASSCVCCVLLAPCVDCFCWRHVWTVLAGAMCGLFLPAPCVDCFYWPPVWTVFTGTL